MNRPHPLARGAARAAHALIARSPLLSKCYLAAFGAFLRRVRHLPGRENVINNLSSYPWPDIRFGPVKVQVCAGQSIRIIPHPGEFDFRALFSPSLDYEVAVFDFLMKRIGAYDAVVEIGANVGVYSVFFAARRRSAGIPVFCFEPSRRAFGRLEENFCAAHAPPNVHLIPAAVSDVPGLVAFFEPRGHLTNGSLSKEFAGLFSTSVDESLVAAVDGTAIDALVCDYRTVLIKIDVEGAEARVLQTLRQMIIRARPDIILEVLEPLLAPLNGMEFLAKTYRFFLITEAGLVEKERFETAHGYRDYFLRPRTAAHQE